MKLKSLITLILVLPIFMGVSCQKKMFEFTSNVNLNKTFVVSEDGSFLKIQTISDNEIRNLLDDLPKDAKVTDVTVSSLSVRIIPQADNGVKFLTLAGSIEDTKSKDGLFLGAEYPVPLIGVNAPFVGINNLIAGGLSKARANIKDIIMKNQFGDFELILEGTPKFIGNKLRLNVQVRIAIQIEYQQCVEVWDYLDAGEECTLESEN
ncbi:MAG: hypothetical protein V3V16_09350 [Melioribacteraceae bacterium]